MILAASKTGKLHASPEKKLIQYAVAGAVGFII
jgi:hypothetical protein